MYFVEILWIRIRVFIKYVKCFWFIKFWVKLKFCLRYYIFEYFVVIDYIILGLFFDF